jgi:hypothetical protein
MVEPRENSALLDLSGMNRSDLLALHLKLGSDMDAVRSQLEKAKSTYRITRTRSDEDWFRRASSVVRIRGRQMQQVQIRLSELKAEEKRQMAVVFMRLARVRLKKEEFKRLLDEAKSECGISIDEESRNQID